MGNPLAPAIIRRNTIAMFGPSEGVAPGKNSEVILNDVFGVTDVQLDGSLLQSGAHDYLESGYNSRSNANQTLAWSPPLCDRSLHPAPWLSPALSTEADCLALAGCIWENGSKCSGFPSHVPEPPSNVYGAEASGKAIPKPRHGVSYRFNWVHDSRNTRTSKRGLRFDRYLPLLLDPPHPFSRITW